LKIKEEEEKTVTIEPQEEPQPAYGERKITSGGKKLEAGLSGIIF